MTILGIETSCDETSAAIVDGIRIKSNIISTQMVHQEYGGVVPEFASRAHIRQLLPIMHQALETANIKLSQIQGIAVTYGPGLAGSLLVGLCVAKSLSLQLEVPWVGVNHIEGHILATTLSNRQPAYPYVCLVVSGGHTLLVYVKKPMDYKIIGRTIDDAAGEAFDKVAKILGLGFPGGPAIENIARQGDHTKIRFPRALLDKNNLDFSFSGLKTSVLYHVKSLKQPPSIQQIADISASFQQAVLDVLLKKSIMALQRLQCSDLVLAGGVIRNSNLRDQFQKMVKEKKIKLHLPSPELCTDNAAMIARAGHVHLENGERSSFNLDVNPNLCLDHTVTN
ncbi:tRNA (adenosine(37)-N6)-threonylcarbamoyltransferase complex transferase subunit TsaD [candidate division KSB1 bacterium]|nr:tRNA (adenosine(37)-N6)-threonylcarbamoyltransferase complex transferase subunit TsaD [candidate division KSB1 bacterium]